MQNPPGAGTEALVRSAPEEPAAAAVDAYFASIRRRDYRAWEDSFTEAAVVHDPVGAAPAEGADGRKEVWNVLTAPFSRLDIRPQRTFCGGNGAAVYWHAEATGTNGGQASFEGISVFEFDAEGKIEALMSYWDPAAVMIALAGERA